MDDEAEVRFVEPHSQRRGGHERLDPVVFELLLKLGPLLSIGPAGVGTDLVTPVAQNSGDVFGRADRERVDDSRTGEITKVGTQPCDACARVESGLDPEPEGVTGELAADDGGVVAELFGDIGDHPGVGGGCCGEDRGVPGSSARMRPIRR